jgi:hypothetical protein
MLLAPAQLCHRAVHAGSAFPQARLKVIGVMSDIALSAPAQRFPRGRLRRLSAAAAPQEGMWTRFFPATEHARTALAEGAIGEVKTVSLHLA